MHSNYTTSYSAVDDRFQYSKKGIFWCRKKHQNAYIAVYIAVCTLIFIGIWALDIVASLNLASIVYSIVFDALKLVSLIAYPLFLIGGVRMILSGDQYNFNANEEKMLITCPKKNFRSDIYYANVLNVEYKEINGATKVKGYNVTVYCKDGIKTFDFLFPSKTTIRHPDMTPFRMIEERAGLLEKPEFLAGQRIDNAGFIG